MTVLKMNIQFESYVTKLSLSTASINVTAKDERGASLIIQIINDNFGKAQHGL